MGHLGQVGSKHLSLSTFGAVVSRNRRGLHDGVVLRAYDGHDVHLFIYAGVSTTNGRRQAPRVAFTHLLEIWTTSFLFCVGYFPQILESGRFFRIIH